MADIPLIRAVRDRALARPWLLAPPALGAALFGAVSPWDGAGGVLGALLLTALTTSAVTAVFAELWLGDGARVDPVRAAGTWSIYLIPYPLLLVVGGIGARVAYGADSKFLIYAMLGASKVAALLLGAASSLAVARRDETRGVWRALGLGFGSAARGAAFLLPAMTAVWAVQECAVYVAGALLPGVVGSFITIAVPLLGCVALPLEARRAGRLK